MSGPEGVFVEGVAEGLVVEVDAGVEDGFDAVVTFDDVEPLSDAGAEGVAGDVACFFDVEYGWQVAFPEFDGGDEVSGLGGGVAVGDEIVVGAFGDAVCGGLSPVALEAGVCEAGAFGGLDEGEADPDVAFVHAGDLIPGDVILVVGDVDAEDGVVPGHVDAEVGV